VTQMSWLSERSRNGGIDEVPLPDPTWGRLWLCGKHFVGPDPHGALARTAAKAIVCLNEGYELRGRYPDYVEWLVANGGTRCGIRGPTCTHRPSTSSPNSSTH
jgi:hypothetical protein